VKKSHIGRWPRHVLTATVKSTALKAPIRRSLAGAPGPGRSRHSRRAAALLQAITTVQDGGDPPGVDASYYHARAIEKIFPRSSTWRETVLPEMYADDGSLAAVH